MRARSHHGNGHGEEHGIDLAPMLDFVLNLLIFFIITTSFVREPGIFVNPAEAETAIGDQKANILIAVRSNGEIWMDRHQVDIRDVRPNIERLHLERPDDTVIVVADKGTASGLVAQVMDEVKLGGISEVGLGAATPGGS